MKKIALFLISLSVMIRLQAQNLASVDIGITTMESAISSRTLNIRDGSFIRYLVLDENDNSNTSGAKITFDGMQVIQGERLYITSETQIALASAIQSSDSTQLSYKIDKNDFAPYQDKFKISEEGAHQIVYSNTSDLNEPDKIKTNQVIVDNTAPVINHVFSLPPVRRLPVDGHEYALLPVHAKIYLRAVDNIAGVATITYTVNGGLPIENTTIDGFTNGTYDVEVKARDILGNESSEMIRFIIE